MKMYIVTNACDDDDNISVTGVVSTLECAQALVIEDYNETLVALKNCIKSSKLYEKGFAGACIEFKSGNRTWWDVKSFDIEFTPSLLTSEEMRDVYDLKSREYVIEDLKSSIDQDPDTENVNYSDDDYDEMFEIFKRNKNKCDNYFEIYWDLIDTSTTEWRSRK